MVLEHEPTCFFFQAEKGAPTIPSKSKSESKDKDRKHKKHRDRDKDKDREHKKHKHKHKDRSKDKDKDKDRDRKKDKNGHHDSGDHSKKHHDKVRTCLFVEGVCLFCICCCGVKFCNLETAL